MTLVAAMMAVTMNAQNNFYVGGSLGVEVSTQSGGNTKFSVMPEFGIKFNEKMGVGTVIGYTDNGNSNSSFTFAPYFRYTACQMGPVSVFGDAQVTYSSIKNGGDNIAIGVKPGIAYSLNDKFSLVAKFGDIIGYDDNAQKVNILKLNFSKVDFGFFYNF